MVRWITNKEAHANRIQETVYQYFMTQRVKPGEEKTAAMLEVLRQDFVRTARAKGLAERVVIVGHALKNALLPVVTVIGFRVAFLLSGTIVVETIFAIPGIGRLFTDSIFRLDYQVVQSLVVIFAVLVVVVNLLTDLTYGLLNPRIRYE